MTTNEIRSDPPPKQSQYVWLRIVAAVIGIACLALVAAVVSFWPALQQITSPQKINVSFGTLEGMIYTSNRGNFSCDFGTDAPEFSLSDEESNHASTGGADGGSVSLLDNMGIQRAVGYFVIPDESLRVLKDSDARKNLNLNIAEALFGTHKPGTAQILLDEIVDQENVFRITYNPEASHVIDPNTGKSQDFMNGTLIFNQKNRVYTVYSGISIAANDTQPKDQKFEIVKKMVYDLFDRCVFKGS